MNNKRSSYLIEKEFQISFILRSLLIVAASFFISFSAILFFFYRMENYGRSASLPETSLYFQFLQDQKMELFLIGLAAFFLLSLIVLFWSLITSNKIAGPLYRLKLDLMKYKYGEEVLFSFREGDYFTELPELINSAINRDRQN
jgi:hypothetical protein